MFHRLSKNQFIPKLLILALVYVSGGSTLHAAVITSTDLILQQEDKIGREKLLQTLDRAEVKNALIERGVDPTMAKLRVAAMTADEVSSMNQKMDELPAGSGIVGAALVVFLVLLFTDVMGYTDVFPFVKKTAR